MLWVNWWLSVLLQLKRDHSVKRVDVEEGFINIYLDGVGSTDRPSVRACVILFPTTNLLVHVFIYSVYHYVYYQCVHWKIGLSIMWCEYVNKISICELPVSQSLWVNSKVGQNVISGLFCLSVCGCSWRRTRQRSTAWRWRRISPSGTWNQPWSKSMITTRQVRRASPSFSCFNVWFWTAVYLMCCWWYFQVMRPSLTTSPPVQRVSHVFLSSVSTQIQWP